MADRIDQFESIFKSADKPVMVHGEVVIRSGLLVTDQDRDGAGRVLASVQSYLGPAGAAVEWQTHCGDELQTVEALLRQVEKQKPDLIVSHRGLGDRERHPRFGLGVFLDELTQSTSTPVLVLPCDADGVLTELPLSIRTAMVVADHLTGDNALVDYGAALTQSGGTLILAHIEDDVVFDRYMQAIEKIPEMETETARTLLSKQLLSEPQAYIASCIQVLSEAGLSLNIEPVVKLGHGIRDYRKLLAEHAVDLMVLHTRDQAELALHGTAYLITAEFRKTPLLLI